MKTNNKLNNKIKCNVNSCEHNNTDNKHCELENISISCICNENECHDCNETICESFEETGSNITNNEYEVDSEIETNKKYNIRRKRTK